MKRIIICIPLILIFASVYSQNKNGNTDPTAGSQIIPDSKSHSSQYFSKDPSITDSKLPAGNSENQVYEKTDRSINYTETKKTTTAKDYKSGNEPYKRNPVDVSNGAKDELRKNNSDIPVDFSNGAKGELRKNNSDIPVDFSNGAKDEYIRKNNTAENGNSGSKAYISTDNFTIPESDRHLSDIELNKKYPNRNMGKNVKPATGKNDGTPDKDRLKTAPKSESKPANLTPQNNHLSGDELNRNRK